MKLLLLLALALTACETTDNEGNTTRWDAEGTIKAVDAGVRTWQNIDEYNRRQAQPQPVFVGYNQFGQPIYR